MAFVSRLPIPVNAPSMHNLRKMRSEGQLKKAPDCTLHHLRSTGQLSIPPNEPLSPISLQSPARLSSQSCGIIGVMTSDDSTTDMHGRLSAINSSSNSSSGHSQALETDSVRSSPRNTVLIHQHLDQEKIYFKLRSDSKQTPTLEDLSRLLELRGRLQDMGTSFTAKGEMQAYENPYLNVNLEQMLHFGTEYDALWNAFFTDRSQEGEHNLWPNLRILKRMLRNEGIIFADHHQRLTYGTSNPKLIRLSDQYDVLREERFEKTLSNIHPAERWHQTLGQVEVPKTPMNLGWEFALDKRGEQGLMRKNSRRASRLRTSVGEQPSIRNGSGPTLEEMNRAYPSPPETPESAVDVHVTISALTLVAAAARPRGLTTGAPILVHGSSSLQVSKRASMLLGDENPETQTISTGNEMNQGLQHTTERRYEHTGALEMLVGHGRRRAEERQRHAKEEEQHADAPDVKVNKKNASSKKGKGVRKRLRLILGLKQDGEQ